MEHLFYFLLPVGHSLYTQFVYMQAQKEKRNRWKNRERKVIAPWPNDLQLEQEFASFFFIFMDNQIWVFFGFLWAAFSFQQPSGHHQKKKQQSLTKRRRKEKWITLKCTVRSLLRLCVCACELNNVIVVFRLLNFPSFSIRRERKGLKPFQFAGKSLKNSKTYPSTPSIHDGPSWTRAHELGSLSCSGNDNRCILLFFNSLKCTHHFNFNV